MILIRVPFAPGSPNYEVSASHEATLPENNDSHADIAPPISPNDQDTPLSSPQLPASNNLDLVDAHTEMHTPQQVPQVYTFLIHLFQSAIELQEESDAGSVTEDDNRDCFERGLFDEETANILYGQQQHENFSNTNFANVPEAFFPYKSKAHFWMHLLMSSTKQVPTCIY
jgi:hypothetical protein